MDKKTKKGLGRGIDSLIPVDFDKDLVFKNDEKVRKISIEKIVPTDDQPRSRFDQINIQELADSIKIYGILIPLVVSPLEEDYFQIIAGERRWRAAKLLDLKEVPVIVRSFKENEKIEVALIENVQRVDLSPLEQAVALYRLHQEFSLSSEEIARKIGKAVSTVSNLIRLLKLPDYAKKSLLEHLISEAHARSILALNDYPEQQKILHDLIIKEGWSVRQAERFVVSCKKEGYNQIHELKKRIAIESSETKKLAIKLNTKVFVKRTAKGGKLEILFKNDNQLQEIMKIIL